MPSDLGFRKADIGVFDCIAEGWHSIKDEYWLLLGVTVAGLLIAGAVPFYILLGPMQCGIYFVLRRKFLREKTAFAELFSGFNFFGQSLLATLIVMSPLLLMTAVIMLTILPGIFAEAFRGREYEMPPEVLFTVLAEVLAANIIHLTVQGLAMFTYPLIIDRNLKAWDAIKTSARAVWHNAWGVTLLLLGQGLLLIGGLLMCFFGIYLVLPVIFASVLVAYNRIFGLAQAANPSGFGGSPKTL